MKRDKNYYIRKAFDLCVAEATGSPINNPSDLYEVLRPWAASDQENFLVVFLDSAQRVKSVERITMGLLNRTLLHPREVFAPAITMRSASIIIAHNHPSNFLEPSREDREATKRIARAGEILGIELLDHLIIGRDSFYSFKENGESFS